MQATGNPTVLFLKSRSAPEDRYADLFSEKGYRPIFQPVLDHRFHVQNLALVRSLLTAGQLLPGENRQYGGLIFTSQRAVEAFGNVLASIDQDGIQIQMPKQAESSSTSPGNTPSNYIPLYVVGPATSSLLSSIRDKYLPPPASAESDIGLISEVLGSETGNGDNLAQFILQHYNSLRRWHTYSSGNSTLGEEESRGKEKLPLLFLTGEQHRDAIPKTLMNESLPPSERISVRELVVYEAGIRGDLEVVLQQTLHSLRSWPSGQVDGVIWVVIFSPGSCASILSSLRKSGLYGGDGERKVYIATIGATTRNHLQKNFGVEADVCAESPSPEGLIVGIQEAMDRLGNV